MRSTGPWTRLGTGLALLATLALAAAVDAQQERVQVAGSNLFSDGSAHLLYGVDQGLDIGGGDCQPGQVCTVPEWTFLIGAYGGISVPQDVPLSIYAHVGIEWKATADISIGAVGFAFAQPLQGGPAARLDLIDVGALKLGYGWGDEDGYLIAVEIASAFIGDLFFR